MTLTEALGKLHKAGRVSPNLGAIPPVMPNPDEHGDLTMFKVHVFGYGHVPDLNSPAERGLLLALLREAAGEPHISAAWCVDGWYLVRFWDEVVRRRCVVSPTEAAAIEAALIALAEGL